MIGLDARTGRAQPDEEAHLRASIADILSTPLGTRVMRRDYGSELPYLVDAAANPATRIRLFAATAGALMRQEPRIALRRVRLAVEATGRAVVELDADRVRPGRAPARVTLTVPFPAAA